MKLESGFIGMTHIYIVADNSHPYILAMFPGGDAFSQRDNALTQHNIVRGSHETDSIHVRH